MSHPVSDRRSASGRRRPNLTVVLAAVLPLVTAAGLLLVDQEVPGAAPHAPATTTLTAASVACPSALAGADTAYVGSADPDASGQVTVTRPGSTSQVDVGSGVTPVRGAKPLVLAAQGSLAPGLLAGRSGGRRLAATGCPAASSEVWFTGLGAGAGHTSVLELVNPVAGPAIADITVYGRSGVVDVPRLRGVSVPGRGSIRLDLGQVVPRRDELALHVVTSRGRLAATVLDRVSQLDPGPGGQDWLPAQAAPDRSNLLLGVPGGQGRRTLLLANPGDDEARATLRIVSGDSTFAPQGVDEVRVAPQSVTPVTLSDVLGSAAAKGALGLLVTSTAPLTATLRSYVDRDLSHAVGAATSTGPAAAVVPAGAKQVLLAGADAAGVVTVEARGAGGDVLVSKQAEVRPSRGTAVDVPGKAVLVTITPERTGVTGAVLVTGNGAAVLPLVELVTSGLVPDVRPGLP